MDFPTAEGARDAKRARLTPSAGDVDLISGVDDDVLLRVLALVPDAKDAARTAALSRRWLRLWTRVPALRFASRPLHWEASAAERCAALERHVSLVDGVLARRARSGCATVESLSISYTWDSDKHMEQLASPACDDLELEQAMYVLAVVGARIRGRLMQASVHAVQGWVRYAFQHGAKSLDLDMELPPRRGDDDGEDNNHRDSSGKKKLMGVHLDGLPSPAAMETMRLALGGARLHLPTAMRFASLKDLSLERIEIADGGGARLLARLVSSPTTCPNLQKLRMIRLRFPTSFSQEMRIEADMLSELWIESLDIMSLELRTPSLRVLHIDGCHNEVLGLSAPRLEQVALFSRPAQGRPLGLLRIDGDLPRVRSLKLGMWSHRHHKFHGGEQNDGCVLLLKRCSSLTRLEVTLGGPKPDMKIEEHVDLIKDNVPHLPDRITSLTVNVSDAFERHDFGVGVANLLTRFTNLTHLSLHLPLFCSMLSDVDEGLHQLECGRSQKKDLECHHPDHWRSHEISMVHLQEVELTGLTGVDCELWFMKAMLATAKRLDKVAISFNPKCRQHSRSKMDAFERMLLHEGMWTSHSEEHMITCLNTRDFFQICHGSCNHVIDR